MLREQKDFTHLIHDTSLYNYVRKRRLTRAASVQLNTNLSIIWAKLEWDNGLTFSDKRYYSGGMEKEDLGKCETIFLMEDFFDFGKEFVKEMQGILNL